MARTCTVCRHPDRAEIDRAMIRRTPFRTIAQQYGVSAWAALRHHDDHVPAELARARDAEEVAQADDLLAQVKALRSKAMGILLAAERQGDYRTALAGIREVRGCLELLAEMEQRIDRRPTLTLAMVPEWLAVRSELVKVLRPYPEAGRAVAAHLVALEGGRAG